MKRATSKDVARLAGVSQTTVSFVMNNTPGVSLSDETRRRVIEAARELQYIPNSFAKGLKTSQSRLLGVFLPSMDNPFYPMLMKYIEKYTVGLSYNVMLCCTYRNPEREKAYLDLCIEKQVDGIIYLFTPNWLKRAVQISHSIPIVLISEKSDDVPLNTISMNGFRCGELLANHLLELGHRRLAYILSPVTSISMTRRMRLEGIQSAVEKAGAAGRAPGAYGARDAAGRHRGGRRVYFDGPAAAGGPGHRGDRGQRPGSLWRALLRAYHPRPAAAAGPLDLRV